MQEDQSLEEFRGAVRSQLEKKGVLDEVRAKLMAEILYSMTENEDGSNYKEVSEENIILNSLILEYLSFNGFKNSELVFLKESGMSLEEGGDGRKRLLSREELIKMLKTEEKSRLPILHSLIK